MPKSILLEKPKTAVFHCRISQELRDRLKALQDQLKKNGGGAVFPIDQIVEDALERAARLAEGELSKRQAPAQPEGPAPSQ